MSGAATIDFDQAVRRDQTLLVEGRVQIACVDRDHGPTETIGDRDLRAQLSTGKPTREGDGMTQELSLVELILDASILVQMVMLILALASV